MGIIGFSLLIFCSLCYVGQTFGNKLFAVSYDGDASMATPVFGTLYGFIVALTTFCYNGLRFAPSRTTVLLGCATGVVLYLFNTGAINAARTGPYAFQSLLNSFGNISIVLAFSTLFWGDGITLMQGFGIAAMLLAFFLFNMKGLNFKGLKSRMFFLWVAILFCSNGTYGVLVDAQHRLLGGAQRNEMIMLIFLFEGIISLASAMLRGKTKLRHAFAMSKKALTAALVSSICAALAINLYMLCLRYVPVSIANTIKNGLILTLSEVLSVTVLREKLEKNMFAAIIVALVSIALLSL